MVIRRDKSPFIANVYNRARDVTPLLQGLPNRAAGRYSVTRLPTRQPVGYGAGWSLIVVYRDSSYPMRNVSLFPGFYYPVHHKPFQDFYTSYRDGDSKSFCNGGKW